MTFYAKTFNELTAVEVYEILKSRAEIFVGEQKIMYIDMDGVDYDSLHCYLWQDGRVTAYLRAFVKDKGSVKVGRVLTLEHGRGHGRTLVEKSIPEIIKHFGCKKIVMDAQKHAEGFYKKLGFETVSDEFLEEGIVHVKMERNI